VHRNGQKADLLPMLQLSYSVAQEWCESCNFLSKRFQSSLLDCVGCAFCDDEGALPIVFAIKQNENFAPVDVAKGLPRISGAAADRIHITSIGAPRLITSRPARSRTTECRPSAPIVSWARICSGPSGVFTCTPATPPFSSMRSVTSERIFKWNVE